MLHQKEKERLRAYPTHQAVQTSGSTASLPCSSLRSRGSMYAYPVEAGGALGYDPLKIAARLESVTYSDFYKNKHTYEFGRIRRTCANRIGIDRSSALAT
jgi:hypothetical protein